jgi:16S rRNA G966 N2-methylase RsmD
MISFHLIKIKIYQKVQLILHTNKINKKHNKLNKELIIVVKHNKEDKVKIQHHHHQARKTI